ncbi:DNA polymerase III subunit beta [Candidatus Kuenenbacteria bacterium]|nr:DNA polymerase III subunit beta [Candidatus Kuenenbacteria bacterium]
MKLTCLQENLNFGLQTTGHLVNKNINLPILNNVMLEAKDGSLRLASTNLEIGISCVVRCKVEKEGLFTVDARLLSEYVNLLANDQVNMELLADDFLKVACLNSKTKIKGIAADDFPVIPKIDKEKPFKVKISDFKKAISQVIFSVSTSETRPEISGVFMSFNKIAKGKLLMVGTDSYRLAEKAVNLEENQEEQDVIVPLKTLQEVLRILNNLKDQANAVEDLEIYISENQILFTCDSIELISRLLEGQYPDYKQIIPTETKTKAVCSTSELTKAIKKVALFSKTGIFDINLVFEAQKGLTVQATNTQVGESKTDVDVEFTGETNDTTLNYRYLLDGLNNIDTSEVEISLVDNNLPCLIKPKDGSDYLYIVMPIKQ